MKKIILSILLISTLGYSQSIERQVVGSAGMTLSDGSTASMDFTIGEFVVTTITDGTSILSQGFHQGEIMLSISLGPVVMLQGPLVTSGTSIMDDTLRSSGLLPTTSPYVDGLTCNTTVFDITGNDAIVDWIWVELRDAGDNSVVIASQSALLQRDGDVVGVDGVSPLSFKQATESYNVSVNHRNHLGIMTASPIALSETNTIVNLTANANIVLGTTNAVVNMSGVFAMYSGDFDENGQIQNSDINSVILLLGGSGYNEADVDMNGQIQNSDINTILYPNLGKGQQF